MQICALGAAFLPFEPNWDVDDRRLQKILPGNKKGGGLRGETAALAGRVLADLLPL
jgi:hypothetical protein